MPKLPIVKPRKVLSALLRAGFYIHHQTGSHINLRHRSKTYLHVVIPNHTRELAPKTLKTILVQAEIDVEELGELL